MRRLAVTESVLTGCVGVMRAPSSNSTVTDTTSSMSLKARRNCAFSPHGRFAEDRRGVRAQRRRLLRAPLYEERGLISSGARRLRAPPLPPSGSAPDRLHRVCSADRTVARRDRHRVGQAARRPAPNRRDWSACPVSGPPDRRAASPNSSDLKSGLTECIGCGCLSAGPLRAIESNDYVGRRGPGPRYWIGDRPRG